eukprot:1254660-Pyramimonas_sp.AAC.1
MHWASADLAQKIAAASNQSWIASETDPSYLAVTISAAQYTAKTSRCFSISTITRSRPGAPPP